MVDADIAAAAAIARTKLASGTANHVVINSGTGALSSEARLALSRFKDDTAGKVLIAQGTGIDSIYQTITGDISVAASGAATIALTAKDATYITLVAGESIAAGDLVYLSAGVAGQVLRALNTGIGTCESVIGIADQAAAASASIRIQVTGKRVVSGSFVAGDRGKRVYVGSTSGAASTTVASAVSSVVFLAGYLIDETASTIVIAPSLICINE